MARNDDYDWLNDPFHEKKAAAERERAHMGGGSKAAVAVGCFVVIVLVIVMFAVGGWILLGMGSIG